MKSIDLNSINKKMDQFISDRQWNQFHSVKNLSMALTIEASELMEIFQWMSEEDSNQIAHNEKLKQKVSEEVADVFFYLSRIALKAGIDIESAVLEKMKKNAEKYPVEKSRGNAKKYTEF